MNIYKNFSRSSGGIDRYLTSNGLKLSELAILSKSNLTKMFLIKLFIANNFIFHQF